MRLLITNIIEFQILMILIPQVPCGQVPCGQVPCGQVPCGRKEIISI